MPWTTYTATGAVKHAGTTHDHTFHTNRTRYIWVSSRMITPDDATAGTSGASPDLIGALSFADAARQGGFFSWLIPSDYASGTISYTIVWAPGTNTDLTTRWLISSEELVAGDTPSEASDDMDEVQVDIAHTDNVTHYSTDATWVFTPVAAGNMVKVNVERAGAGDSNTATALLYGVRIAYTADA